MATEIDFAFAGDALNSFPIVRWKTGSENKQPCQACDLRFKRLRLRQSGQPGTRLDLRRFRFAQRATQQWNEALSERGSNASPRNLLGPLPWGQYYDDPWEPGPHRVIPQRIKASIRKPLEIIREIASGTP